jgi:hypothetical protein
MIAEHTGKVNDVYCFCYHTGMAYNFNLGPLNVHQGSWLGAPDIGLTELIGNLLGQQRTNQGGSNLVGPQPSRAATSGVLGSSTEPYTVQGPPAGYKAGGGGVAQPNTQIPQDILNRNASANTNQANTLFDERAATLRNQLGDAESQKNSLLDQIGATYNNVRQQAKDTLASNLGALDQGKKNVVQGYSDLKTEQSRLLNDTQLRNSLLGRSLGSLNSGFYENLQSKAAANTQANVSKIGQQEQSQLDQIGQEIINQNTDANTKIQNLNETEAQAKNDVLGKYQSLANSISTQLSFNDRGRTDALQQINNQLQNSLDNIAMTMADWRAKASSLGGVQNPLKSIADQANAMGTINKNIVQPIQDQNILNQAYQSINNGTQSFNDVVGYLSQYDKANGTNLAATLQLNVQPQGGIFGFGKTYTAPQAQFTDPQSYLSSLFAR